MSEQGLLAEARGLLRALIDAANEDESDPELAETVLEIAERGLGRLKWNGPDA